MADMDSKTFGSRVYVALTRRRPRKSGYGNVGLLPFFSCQECFSKKDEDRKESNEKQNIIGSPVASWLFHSVWYRCGLAGCRLRPDKKRHFPVKRNEPREQRAT